MSAYAALIHRIDLEVGRLVANLKSHGELDNTILMFFSDNGACPYDRNNGNQNGDPCDGKTAWSDSTGWAWARNAPFRYYKQNQFEGGIATPAIIHWPAGIKSVPGTLVDEPAHLVDVLPTLAEIAGLEVPTTYPARNPSPLAGVSLKPLFDGASIGKRPPIHFLFSSDRALREGNWKLVSFQNEPWELYRIDEDRTELHDLAGKHPEIVARLSAKWHQMASEVLHAPAKETVPVASSPKGKVHHEWSNYTGNRGAETSSRGGAGPRRRKAPGADVPPKVPKIRARTGTRIEIENGNLVVTANGDDPGLAFDLLPEIKPGPYLLTFQIASTASGEGEIYFTTDASTRLPAGSRLAFPLVHDGQWQEIRLSLETALQLRGLRLDVSSGPGISTIKNLTLRDSKEAPLLNWP
jgi:arylsulfatase